MEVSLPKIKQGWQASFVELHYDLGGTDFIVTTEVNVIPDAFSKQQSGNGSHHEL